MQNRNRNLLPLLFILRLALFHVVMSGAVGIGGGLCAVAGASDNTDAKETVPELNQAVLSYCEAELGKQVGDGECGSLLLAALRSAGAQTRFPSSTAGETVWGKPIVTVDIIHGRPQIEGHPHEILPGDILQFSGARFVNSRGVIWTLEHHTAVVSKAVGDRRLLGTLQQNVAGKRTVQQVSMRMADMRTGRVVVYRPLAR